MNHPYRKSQSGAALFTALIFLLILTLIGVTALKDSGLSERMSVNNQLNTMAFNAAESAMDQYIAEYNFNATAPTPTEANIQERLDRISKYLPTGAIEGYVEYCVNNDNSSENDTSVLNQITDDSGEQIFNPTSVTCGETTLDAGQNAVTAKNKVIYQGCPGSCPRYSLGLGKQKVSCHVFLMEAEGTVENSTVMLDQWVSLQGPC